MIRDGLAISSKGGTKMLVYEVKTTRESPSNKLTKLRYQLTKNCAAKIWRYTVIFEYLPNHCPNTESYSQLNYKIIIMQSHCNPNVPPNVISLKFQRK